MRKSSIPTSRIFGYFSTLTSGYEKLGYSRRHMYNEQFKERGSKSADADSSLEFVKGMCTRDDMMFWKHTVNVDGSLKHLFWCDGVRDSGRTIVLHCPSLIMTSIDPPKLQNIYNGLAETSALLVFSNPEFGFLSLGIQLLGCLQSLTYLDFGLPSESDSFRF
ncbi:hypothetical protein MTR_8g045760 [Medicago truncatula]|uniref:Protein FAR1-RELATED SEQUENCE n=1 Tax=Medicago truncatula TaxID=3880 RepID=A0A072TR04_MEDTR|nr:hypothetical protein MTR_8g045760 [Medicago truncatula]